jgi:hypothetical protein
MYYERGTQEISTKVYLENLKERDDFSDLSVDGSIVIMTMIMSMG